MSASESSGWTGRHLTAVSGLSLAAFFLCYAAPLDYTFSDPWGNLVTSQALLEHHTVRLDAYADADAIARLSLAYRHGGHLYSYFPLGTSVLAVPAVALARRAGLDMTRSSDNTALQRLLAALGVALAVPLTWLLARAFVAPPAALAATVAFVFATSTTSTLGTALWSSLAAFLLHLAVLSWLVRRRLVEGPQAPIFAYLAGILLFVAFACRPTAALLMAVVTVYLLLIRPRAALRLVAAFGVGFALFAAFSLSEYRRLVPPYYQPDRLGSPAFATALVGNLVSPSRGVLVLSPFLVVMILAAVVLHRHVLRDPWFRLGAVWAILHWLTISSYAVWWGGWSYGNRFFADAVPAWLLMTLAVMRQARGTWTRQRRTFAATAAGLLTLPAIWIHSAQGLYNASTSIWCQDATYVRHLFDWRHPQWLASPESLGAHRRLHLLDEIAARSPLEPIRPDDRDVLFEGWSRPENGGAWRWSDGPQATILLRLDKSGLNRLPPRIHIVVEAGTYQAQAIDVEVHGEPIGRLSSSRHWESASYRFELSRSLLDRGRPIASSRVLEVTFRIPGARRPADDDPGGRGGDTRRLGIRLLRAWLETDL